MGALLDFPVCLRLQDRPVLVVGGGKIAQSRVDDLLAVGARVHVVAPAVTDHIAQLAVQGHITLDVRGYRTGDLNGCHIVFTAIESVDVSIAIAREARARGLLINAADLPELCDFTLPSVGRKGPISVAVSTDGSAPAVAARLRRELVEHIRPEHVHLARLVGWLRGRLPKGPSRMRLLKHVVDGEVGANLRQGNRRRAFTVLRESLAEFGAMP